MSSPIDAPVLLDVYCGRCMAEGEDQPGRLGQVVVREARWLWISHDRRIGRARARSHPFPDYAKLGVEAGQVITAADFPDLDVPERLGARCRHHGTGSVETSAVLDEARLASGGGRRRIALPLS